MVKLRQNSIFQVLFIGLVSIVFTGCPHDIDDVQDVIINNNSDIELVFYKEYKSQTILDTTLSVDYPWQNELSNFYMIDPYSSKEIREVKSNLQFILSNLQFILSNGSYQYFLFNYDSLITIPWERIRDENIILKKVYFETWEDLEACNFTITYP